VFQTFALFTTPRSGPFSFLFSLEYKLIHIQNLHTGRNLTDYIQFSFVYFQYFEFSKKTCSKKRSLSPTPLEQSLHLPSIPSSILLLQRHERVFVSVVSWWIFHLFLPVVVTVHTAACCSVQVVEITSRNTVHECYIQQSSSTETSRVQSRLTIDSHHKISSVISMAH
jgi:hypothetical protein